MGHAEEFNYSSYGSCCAAERSSAIWAGNDVKRAE